MEHVVASCPSNKSQRTPDLFDSWSIQAPEIHDEKTTEVLTLKIQKFCCKTHRGRNKDIGSPFNFAASVILGWIGDNLKVLGWDLHVLEKLGWNDKRIPAKMMPLENPCRVKSMMEDGITKIMGEDFGTPAFKTSLWSFKVHNASWTSRRHAIYGQQDTSMKSQPHQSSHLLVLKLKQTQIWWRSVFEFWAMNIFLSGAVY